MEGSSKIVKQDKNNFVKSDSTSVGKIDNLEKSLLFEIVKATLWLQTPKYYNWEPHLLNSNSVKVGFITRPITDSLTSAMLQAYTFCRYQAILTFYATFLAIPVLRLSNNIDVI